MAGIDAFVRAIRGFLRSSDGSASVEVVIWTPLFMFIFFLIADTAIIFSDQAQVLRIVQDANRAMSIGQTDETATENRIKAAIASISPNAAVDTTVDTSTGIIRTDVVMPISDLEATGMVGAFDNLSVTVTAQHLSEA